MENILDMIIVSELGLKYPLGRVVQCALFRESHPGPLADSLLAWHISAPYEEMDSLCATARKIVEALPAPNNTLEAVAAMCPEEKVAIDQSVKRWSRISPVSRPDFSVDIQSALFAVYFCDYVNHERNFSGPKLAKAWGVKPADVTGVLQRVDELPIVYGEMLPLQAYVNKHREAYEAFEQQVRNVGYVISEIDPTVRISIDNAAFAVYFMKNNHEPLDLERVSNLLKIENPQILRELQTLLLAKPQFAKGGIEGVYNYAKGNFVKYKEFYNKVQKAEMYIYPEVEGVVVRKQGLRQLVAMRLMAQRNQLDPELVRKMWNLSPEGWDDMMQKMRSNNYIVFNNLDLPELPESLCAEFGVEMAALRKAYEQEYGSAYSAAYDPDNPQRKRLSEMSERELLLQVRKHPDVLAGVQKSQLTRQLVTEAVRANGFALQHVPLKYVTLPLCRLAVTNAGASLRFVPQRYRNNFELCRDALKQEPLAYPYVPKKLRSDQRLIDLAISRKRGGGYNLLYVPKKALSAKVIRRAARTTSVKELYALYEQSQKQHKMSEANARLLQDYNLLIHEQAVPCVGVRSIPEESLELFNERFNNVRDFYEGKLKAEDLLYSIKWPAFYNSLSPVALHSQVFIDLFPLVEHTPDILPSSPLLNEEPVELPVSKSVLDQSLEDWCAKEQKEGGLLYGVRIADTAKAKPALQALMRMDAQLATAYRQKQITSRDYFSNPLRDSGAYVAELSEYESVMAANSRTEFWSPASLKRVTMKRFKR